MRADLPRFTLLALSLLGCDHLETLSGDNAPPANTASGDQEAPPFRLELLETESCPLPDGLDPKKVTIHSYRVKLTSELKSGVPANYFYASLLTTDGQRYLAEFSGCSDALNDTPLKKGESIDGYLNFPVPPSKTPETLVYAPKLLELSTAESTLELPVRADTSKLPDADKAPP